MSTGNTLLGVSSFESYMRAQIERLSASGRLPADNIAAAKALAAKTSDWLLTQPDAYFPVEWNAAVEAEFVEQVVRDYKAAH
ncbi:MAG: hypothetical protein JWR07_1890 [Nevskia sp.]|nr:hypothetical protein [Nevskia sp.]